MRTLVSVSLTVMLLGAWLDGGPTRPGAENGESEVCTLTLQLIDKETTAVLPGLVQLRDASGKTIAVPELLDRGFGLSDSLPIHDWQVLPGKTKITVPQTQLALQGFSGLETEFAEAELDLRGKKAHELSLPLTRFFDADKRGYRCANTHLHLRRLSRAQADRYLVEVSEADGLDIVFVSHLERFEDDLEYTSNKYSKQALQDLSTKRVYFDHGEEHRHNFEAYGEGYGHVMLLDIPELIHPVSIGPGISGAGNDSRPLRTGIDEAREAGGKVIWCHNAWGLEDIPSWLSGRLHANNIFDGGTRGSYKHSFYRYLDIGIKVPFSTGTDWFMYDSSRVYVPAKKRIKPNDWLDVLAEGRSLITNGPLLEFSVDQKHSGDVIKLDGPRKVKVQATAYGRMNFERLELVQTGAVVQRAETEQVDGHYESRLDVELAIEQPCWLAVRTPPPSSKIDPTLSRTTPLNEYGCELFSHTSAILVDVGGKRIFRPGAAESLLEEVLRSQKLVSENGRFASEAQRGAILKIYQAAANVLRARMERAKDSEARR